MNIPTDKLEICLDVLQQVSQDPNILEHSQRFKSLIAKIYKQGKKSKRRELRETQQTEDQNLKAMTVIVQQQKQSYALPNSTITQKTLNKPVNCYICKKQYTQIHFFYHSLCPQCAIFNYQKRQQKTDLRGRVALVTGGRIKIGYQTALRMLRDGAKVIVTTRFPHDCAKRFSKETDFAQWHQRLQIHGIDLRNIQGVEAFANYLIDTEPALDIIINNAAQTIKRPLEFYQHLLAAEQEPLELLSAQLINVDSTKEDEIRLKTWLNVEKKLSATNNVYFPANAFDVDGQQLDKRPINSWLLKLDEISSVEMLEVQLVNNIAPFILNSKLKKIMLQSNFERRFIINVSAMEGQFNRENKTVYHAHTNMAKAALNMMTRTAADDYASDGIYMNSVDTGWITDENPYPKKTYLQEKRNFYPPLDIIDGMARIYDPIVQGLENINTPIYGYFLKDYQPYPW